MKDNINPDHYKSQCSIECIEAMELMLGPSGMVSFCGGNAFKYLWRHKNKNGQEDIQKARWYIYKAKEIIAEHENLNYILPCIQKLEDLCDMYEES